MKDTRRSFDEIQKPTEDANRESGLKRKREYSYKEYDYGIDNIADNYNAAIQNYDRRSLEIPSSSKYSKGRSPDVGVIMVSRQGVSRGKEVSLGDRKPFFLHKGRGGGVKEASDFWNSLDENMQRRMHTYMTGEVPYNEDREAGDSHARWWKLLKPGVTSEEGQSNRGQENPNQDVQGGNEASDFWNSLDENMQRRMCTYMTGEVPYNEDKEAGDNHAHWWELLKSGATNEEEQSNRRQENPSHDAQRVNEVQDIESTIRSLIMDYSKKHLFRLSLKKFKIEIRLFNGMSASKA